MKTINKVPAIAISLCLLIFSGCEPAFVPNQNTAKWRTFDPNDYGITAATAEDGSKRYGWSMDAEFDEDNNSIPYWRSETGFWGIPVVAGQLNGKTYPILFDTGNSVGLMVEDVHISRHNLPVWFIDSEDKKNSSGFAIVESLTVGPLQLKDYPCSFLKHHTEFRLLGALPVGRFQWVVMPMDMIGQFSYLQYDSIQKELSFSRNKRFRPADRSEWITFPFEIETKRILLKTSIEDIEVTLFLDTGAGYQLELDTAIIKQLRQQRPDLKKAWVQNTQLYSPYEKGSLKVRKFTATNLKLDSSTLKKAELFYKETPDQGKSYPHKGTNGTIGIGLFDKTTMVLDFKRNLMWVKKAKGSRFEE